MRQVLWILTTVWMVGLSATAAQAKGPALGGGLQRPYIVVGEHVDEYVGVWVDVPHDALVSRVRPPMALSLVVDTSGSMSGHKIAHAREAAIRVLGHLREGDVVSVYGFADNVTQIAPPTVVGPGSMRWLYGSLEGLSASGSTNMYDGLQSGLRSLQEAGPRELRRMIVISDGQANVGPSDPASLGDVAARGTEFGVQVTSIGVGLDYDESTLGALAVRSAGRFYHLEHPQQMAAILEQELDLLGQTVATGAYIEIIPAPGVIILDGGTPGVQKRGNVIRIPVGALHPGQHREALVRARFTANAAGQQTIGKVRLVSRPAGKKKETVVEQPLTFSATTDRNKAARNRNGQVLAMVQAQQAVQAQLLAARALNKGDTSAATRHLAEAESKFRSAAKVAPKSQRKRLQDNAASARQQRSRAGSASTPSEVRGAALEANDSAYDAQGY